MQFFLVFLISVATILRSWDLARFVILDTGDFGRRRIGGGIVSRLVAGEGPFHLLTKTHTGDGRPCQASTFPSSLKRC